MERLVFTHLADAREYAKCHQEMIYCQIEGYRALWVFQVYPGGRTIRWPAAGRHLRRFREQQKASEADHGDTGTAE